MRHMEEVRLKWIDIAKAIGMFFIVLGHVCKANYRTAPLRILCYSFQAQMFFCLSGITFLGVFPLQAARVSHESVRGRLRQWIQKIVIPYFCWGFISILVYALMGELGFLPGEDTRIVPNLFGLLYGSSVSAYFRWNRPLWFLPCLFLLYLSWLMALKFVYTKVKTETMRNISICLCSVAALQLVFFLQGSEKRPFWPWHLETVIYVCPFMGAGILYKNCLHQQVMAWSRGLKMAVCAGAAAIACTLGAASVFTDLRQGEFSGYFRFFAVSLSLTFAMVLIAQVIEKNSVTEYIGKRTLPILLLHKFPVLFFQQLCPYVRDLLAVGDPLVEIVSAILSIGLCLAAAWVLERVCPWSIGMDLRR